MDLHGKRVTVMGLGLHGGAIGTIKWLHAQGAILLVTDVKSEQELASSVEALRDYPGITYILGKHREQDFIETDLVIRNPGVPSTSPLLAHARERDIPIEMDSSLFFLNSPTTDIIGITGSKGKTTATKAIAAVLSAGGRHVVEVGSDGASPLGRLLEVTKQSIVVFELSSWRLEALREHKMSPHTAVVTSILPDHLNTYPSMEAYIETKKTISQFQGPEDITYLNGDDAILQSWSAQLSSAVKFFTFSQLTSNEFGIATNDLQLVGDHQKRNVLPAILIGLERGIPLHTIKEAVTAFTPLPHRLETVRELNGVTFINNSAATIPDATCEALKTMNAESLVLILGGGNKNLSFASLVEYISSHPPRALVWLPGTATDEIQPLLTNIPSTAVSSMSQAIQSAKDFARVGDTVLLSPGATSFGLFKHEFDRGDQFRQIVNTLN